MTILVTLGVFASFILHWLHSKKSWLRNWVH